MDADVLADSVLIAANSVLLLLLVYFGAAFGHEWMTRPHSHHYVRKSPARPSPNFSPSEEIWRMSMDDAQPRKSHWITKEHSSLLRRADPDVRKHGDPIRRLNEDEAGFTTGTRTTEDVTKTMAENEDKKRNRKMATTKTAKTEDIEARWRRKKAAEK